MQAKDQALEIDRMTGYKPAREEIVNVMTKHGLTAKQAGYALATVAQPYASEQERAVAGGYAPTSHLSDGGRVLKSANTQRAIAKMTAERVRVKEEAGEFVKALASDARGAIQNELAEHAKNPNVTPNQTRAVELLGKMHGTFIDRLELDAGPHTRARYADEILGNNSQPSQENG